MDFLNLGHFCDNCGLEIESRPATQNGGVVITGFEPMEHRHVASMDSACAPVQTEAKPYSDCGLYDDYRAAMEEVNTSDEENPPKSVLIPKERFDELQEAEHLLECLKAFGVENWHGYSDAQEMMGEE